MCPLLNLMQDRVRVGQNLAKVDFIYLQRLVNPTIIVTID